MKIDRHKLEYLYRKYNRREFVHPDPLEFLYGYPDVADREIVGLIASSLAYGRVAQILKSVSQVLARMPSPAKFLQQATTQALADTFAGFKHRFTTDEELILMLQGIKQVVEEYGSLNRCFLEGLGKEAPTVHEASKKFSQKLSMGRKNSLLPLPSGTSECKRLNLYLRWMVRNDEVDPGGWDGVGSELLIVPLDTHMHRISIAMGLTGRRQADIRTAHEITDGFRRMSPGDAVRYDFTLTRLGIRRDQEMRRALEEWGILKAA